MTTNAVAHGPLIVPIDGSEGSRRALEEALRYGKALGAPLLLLEVVEEFGPLPGKFEAGPDGVDRTAWLAQTRLSKVRDLLDATDVPWSLRVEEGYPAELICSLAKDVGAPLIVMGHRGITAAARLLIGSVSDKVVRDAPCSVMIVR